MLYNCACNLYIQNYVAIYEQLAIFNSQLAIFNSHTLNSRILLPNFCVKWYKNACLDFSRDQYWTRAFELYNLSCQINGGGWQSSEKFTKRLCQNKRGWEISEKSKEREVGIFWRIL